MGKNKRKRDLQNKLEIVETQRRLVLKNLKLINRSNGLLVGTNSVLRNLEKKQLSAVFICSDKACAPIFRAVSFWCKETNVPLFTLQAEEKQFLSSDTPVSITYGIKRESMHLHPDLQEIFKQIKPSQTNKTSESESNVNSEELKNTSPEIVPMKREKEIFIHHKKHSDMPRIKKSKLEIEDQKDFLAFCSSSDSEEEFKFQSNDSEFPEYKSVKIKDSDIIIK